MQSIWEGESYRKLRDALDKGSPYSICRTCAVVTPPVYLIPKKNMVDIPIIPITTV
jgi:hypothetical protein